MPTMPNTVTPNETPTGTTSGDEDEGGDGDDSGDGDESGDVVTIDKEVVVTVG